MMPLSLSDMQRTWSTHGELTWNAGERPVEGYTGILYPLLLAGGLKIGFPLLEFSKVIVSFAFVFTPAHNPDITKVGVRPLFVIIMSALYFLGAVYALSCLKRLGNNVVCFQSCLGLMVFLYGLHKIWIENQTGHVAANPFLVLFG